MARASSIAFLAAITLWPSSCLGQGRAGVLEPVSAPDEAATMRDARAVNHPVVLTVNDRGELLLVWRALRARTHIVRTLVGRPGAWPSAELPLPPDQRSWHGSDLHNGAWHGEKFGLLVGWGLQPYVYEWTGGRWRPPLKVPPEDGGRRLNYDAAGNPVLFSFNSQHGKRFARYANGQWQDLRFRLPIEHAWLTVNELLRGRTGALHMLVRGSGYVPTVLSVPPDRDPLDLSSWVFHPPLAAEQNSPLSTRCLDVNIALDWPRQTVWAAWLTHERLFVAHAPLGSTSAAAWTTWPVPTEEGVRVTELRLASSGAGAVGIAYHLTSKAGSKLAFRWLPPTGLGEELALARPGSQTEAADFTNIVSGTISLAIGPNGTAWFAVVGRKRGEQPANIDRIYLTSITGGAVIATEPAITGGGGATIEVGEGTEDQGHPQQDAGGKPDLEPQLALNIRGYRRDGRVVYRLTRADVVLRPQLTIKNNGAQYFGDLTARLEVDGVVVNWRKLDESHHMRPMLARGAQVSDSDLAAFRYASQPQLDWKPPTFNVTGSRLTQTVSIPTGLGRKRVRLIVDPDNAVDEANEDNNVVELEYEVSDASDPADRQQVTDERGMKRTVGLNDVGFLGVVNVAANTRIARPGLVQRPTSARLILGNPNGASFFRDVVVQAKIDDQVVWEHTIPVLDAERRLYNRETEGFGVTGPPRRTGPEVRGGFLDVPLDLTHVAVGEHTLTLVVDPEDRFADLNRANNTATQRIRVREPGGTLQVEVRDLATGRGLGQAHVLLRGLFFDYCDPQGRLTIADVPAGSYDRRDLWASRPYPEPAYAEQPATAAFVVHNHETTTVSLALEPPVEVVVTVLDQETGEAPEDTPYGGLFSSPETSVGQADEVGVPSEFRGGKLRFQNVPPGHARLQVGAYAYQTVELEREVHRDAAGRYELEVRLPRAPRGTISGVVNDNAGRPLAGAAVWLNGAPRATTTDNAGRFTLANVAAGQDYGVVAHKKGYLPDQQSSGAVVADGTRTLTLRLPKLTDKLRTLSVDCIAWAQVEEFPGFSFGPIEADSYKVSAEHGKFSATMGMLYREVQGQDSVIVDSVVLGTVGKAFWASNVSTSYDLTSVISAGVEKIAGKNIAQLVSLINPLNDTYSFLSGDVDPSRMDEGEVCGSFTSQTGASYREVTLIPMTSVDLGIGFQGGRTVVRTDILEVSDGAHTKTIRRQWYSPQTAAYSIGETFARSKLEVRFYVSVLNDRLSPGPLYASSQNRIIWKPLEDKWLRFEPWPYEAL